MGAAWLTRLWGMLLDFLFPRYCVGCGSVGSFLCTSCRAALPYLQPPYCQRCGRPVSYGRLCPWCGRQHLTIDGVRGVCIYGGTIRSAIHQIKYRRVWGLSDTLGELLYEYWRAYRLPGVVVVPVPLHRDRLRRRGYNQSRLLADAFARRAGLPVVDGPLVRQRDTPSQVDMPDPTARWRNVQGAFVCAPGAFAGQAVLLVDDVATTVGTLDACAVALRAAGASSVWGLVVARAGGR